MSNEANQIEDIINHLLAGGDVPPHAKSKDPLVQKLHALARERIKIREGTRVFSYLSTISHELRTPLNAIIGYSELLLEEQSSYDPESLKADVERIHNAGRHLLGLVNEVIEVARIESGHTQLERRTLLIEPLVNELIPTLMPAVRRQGNQFSWQVARDLRVWTDAAKLRTVLRTLVNRASRVTTHGEIILRAWRKDETLYIEVEDTGERVSTEDLARTFHPFTGGAGEGLTSTARLVELIGGDLEVEAIAKGTKFRISLPASTRATQEEEPLPVVPHGTPVVLVMTGDPAMRQLITRHLDTLECVVMNATSGTEAIRIAEAMRPAVIALEAGLNEVEGWHTLSVLKSRPELASIPVVLLSGDQMGETLAADDFVTKPFDRNAMLSTISGLLSEGDRKRILVVDDEPDARELARRVLTSAGYIVDEVPNGVAAMGYLAKERPDLILLDLMMPEMDGFQVIEQLKGRSELSNIPVVVLTAMSLADKDRAFLQERTQSVVTKGAAPSALLDRIASIVTQA